jgi:hypothetical protein
MHPQHSSWRMAWLAQILVPVVRQRCDKERNVNFLLLLYIIWSAF